MDFMAFIEAHRVVVGDGAMGSQLMARGLTANECGELWNLENAKVVEQIQREYAEAGADFLITNTFSANAVVCERHGVGEMAETINAAAVQIARRAGGEGTFVLGGLGPTGSLLEPFGDLKPDAAREAFAAQVRALADAGVDAIICETFESSDELRLALEGARASCGLPLVASMKFTREPSGRYRSMMGEGPEVLARVAAECCCAAAGANCVKGIEESVGLVEVLSGLLSVPVLIEPNAGLPALVEGRTVYPEGADLWREHLPALRAAGARLIGGCCGTRPEHIRAVRMGFDRHSPGGDAMPGGLADRIAQCPLLVGDGAMGTTLMDAGLPPGACGAAWNLERPQEVERVHRAFVEAGADFVLTNTFRANPIALARHGLAGECEALNREGARIARSAAGDAVLIFGDLGPTGGLLEPYGDLSEAAVEQAYRVQARALAEAGVDALLFETFQSAAELRCGLRAARQESDLPLIASMTFAPQANGAYRDLMGEGPEALVRLGAEFGCAAIGTNCGQGIRTMPLLVAEIRRLAPGVPIICQPNAGVPKLEHGVTVYREDAAVFGRWVPEVYAAGAGIIGGCDGATAEHVRVIRVFADGL
jgi:5-methyltetrahydrofolate--homocysteine methyltransferase